MNKRLYVGNLSYNVNDKELNDLFAQVGTVVYAKVITRTDGKSKGFGFVEMSTEEEAKTAIEKYEGFMLNNREMKVNEAKAQDQPRSNFGNTGRGGYGNNRRGGYSGSGSGYRSSGSGSGYKGSGSGYKSRFSDGNSSGKSDLNLKLIKLRKDLNSKLNKNNT
ncbi:RNA-binding protein [bacterium]|nr:RNA-binding protein [bacterium]